MLGIATPLLDQGAIQFMILVVMLVIVAVDHDPAIAPPCLPAGPLSSRSASRCS